jgi:hypothetical protein
MAAHESARMTKLYDRRNDIVTLDEGALGRVRNARYWRDAAAI